MTSPNPRETVPASRLSSLLSPSPSLLSRSSSSLSSYPIPTSTSSLPVLPLSANKRTAVIYDRSITKGRGGEVALGAWAFMFSEIVQYTQKRVSGIGEFEKRYVPPPPPIYTH